METKQIQNELNHCFDVPNGIIVSDLGDGIYHVRRPFLFLEYEKYNEDELEGRILDQYPKAKILDRGCVNSPEEKSFWVNFRFLKRRRNDPYA